MTEREKRTVRKRWRTNQKHKRKRDKDIIDLLSTNTPPDSPDERTSVAFPVDVQKSPRRKKVRKDRAKAYREIKKLKDKLQKKEKDIEKYRKTFAQRKSKIYEKCHRLTENKNLKIAQRPKCFQRSKTYVELSPCNHKRIKREV